MVPQDSQLVRGYSQTSDFEYEDAEEEDIAKQYLLKYINEKLQGKISEFDVQEFNNSPEYKEAFEQLKFVFEKIGWIDTSSSSSSTNQGGGNKYKSIKKRKTKRRRNKPNKKTRRKR